MSTGIVTPVNALMQDVLKFQYNPALIQRAVLNKLSEASNGTLEIVDPTNPFVFCLEAAAVLTSGFLSKNETNTRKQYPYSAQNAEDLYGHMSDRDYINRFATPATTQFSLLIPKEEILTKMVTDPTTGIRKLVIPRNTFFTIAGVDFSLQYPIEIRQLAHGGIQIVYDVEITSPLQNLSTNVIDHEIKTSANGDFIFFSFDVMQFNIISKTGQLDSSSDFKLSVMLTDQYYYTRVYVEGVNGQWAEIYTTHTDQIYNIMSPTAVLKVVDNTLLVSIPQIYTSNLLLNKAIRIDIYQTKGPIDMVLFEYPMSAFIATWQTFDISDDNVYVAPLKAFRTIIPYSDKVVSGGSNAMSFETLRQRVIMNAIGSPSLPITPAQISGALALQGYEVVKDVDNVTNRIFLATKEMPSPVNTNLITSAAASIGTVALTVASAIKMSTILDNGTSITITPETLYRTANGITSIVPDDVRAAVLALPVDKRALTVTNGGFLYTPFHYVLDMSSAEFECRPYYLDAPEIETKLFVSENDTTLIQVATQTYGIVRSAKGYELHLVTQSGDAYKELSDNDVFVQLAFTPAGEKDRAYLLGELIGKTELGERIYTFDLSTNFNVDVNDKLELSQFFLYTQEPRLTKASLITDFDIIYSTSVDLGTQWQADNVDLVLGKFLLPTKIAGITHELLRVRFGYSLNTLWSRARSVISSVPYKTWDVNVPRLYEANVYQRDAHGSTITIDSAGHAVSTLLHEKGSPVLNADGSPVYQWQIGDNVLDGNGNPIPSDVRSMIRQIDIMLIEGAYWFATDLTAIDYRMTMTQVIVDWLINDLSKITSQLLEKTRIYFYPKTTLGIVNVMVTNGVIKSISAGQAFLVDLFVSKNVYSNNALRAQLTNTTIKTISNMLKNTVISLDAITTELRNQYGDDVISVRLSGLGGSDNLQALTIIDDSNRCSIRKRLVALPDNSLIVEEDVTCNFIKHELTT